MIDGARPGAGLLIPAPAPAKPALALLMSVRRAYRSRIQRLLRLHLVAVVVAEQVEQRVHERCTPCVADDLGAYDDVAELPRHPLRERVARVDRERERIRGLVDPEVLVLQ